MKSILVDEGLKICGIKRNGRPTAKETWWWSAEVQMSAQKKREAYKVMQRNKIPETNEVYNICEKRQKEM